MNVLGVLGPGCLVSMGVSVRGQKGDDPCEGSLKLLFCVGALQETQPVQMEKRTRPMSTADINVTHFRQRVFDAVQAIPVGEVRTYGEIADVVGSPGGGIAVGQALMPLNFDSDHGVPFWRVVLADGSVNTAAAEADWPEAVARHRRMLVDEGVAFTDDGRVASLSIGSSSKSGRGARSAINRPRIPEPCWKHATVQYSCRDCAPVAR
jgi:alkylated DNA nucleotide flippase Atl1